MEEGSQGEMESSPFCSNPEVNLSGESLWIPGLKRIGSWMEVSVVHTRLFFLALWCHRDYLDGYWNSKTKRKQYFSPPSELLLAVEAIIENSWLFIALGGNKTMKALKTAL